MWNRLAVLAPVERRMFATYSQSSLRNRCFYRTTALQVFALFSAARRALFRNLQEFRWLNFQDCREFADYLKPDKVRALFQLAQIGSVYVGLVGEVFLRKPGGIANPPQIKGKHLAQVHTARKAVCCLLTHRIKATKVFPPEGAAPAIGWTASNTKGEFNMRKIAVLMVVALISGCAQGIPPLNFSVPDVTPSDQKISAELKSITISLAHPDEKAGSLPPDAEIAIPLWKEALEAALNRLAIFRDDASRKVSLAVTVLDLQLAGPGFSMTSESTARYELIDRDKGNTIFSTDIHTTGHVPMDFAYLGVARMREAANRAVRENISEFLRRLKAWSAAGEK
jgi:hypothetical protein